MTKKNMISSLVWIIFFAYFYVASQSLMESAALWPSAICLVGVALSALSALTSWVEFRRDKAGAGSWEPFSREQGVRILKLTGILVVWILLLKNLGFLVSCIGAQITIFSLFEPVRTKRNICTNIIIAIFFSACVYGLFRALGVSLPSGILL